MTTPDIAAQMKMDPAALYREETFTDRKVGTIQRLTPIRPDGSMDDKRAVIFLGQTQILTQVGALPVAFEIDAKTLDEAAANFAASAKTAIERTMKELQQLRREAASSIVIPERGVGAPGGLPGGGKIQFP